jgi:hypothetical protein
MRGRVFKIALLLSMLLFATTTALWIGSWGKRLSVICQRRYFEKSNPASIPIRADFSLEFVDGQCVVERYTRYDMGLPGMPARNEQWMRWLRTTEQVDAPTMWEFIAGQWSWINQKYAPSSANEFVTVAIVPAWVPLVVSLLSPLCWGIRRIRMRSHIAKGLCPACHYNLTGNTSGVCPECGRAIAPAHI